MMKPFFLLHKKLIIVLASLVGLSGAWAGLTYAGFIPDVLHIKGSGEIPKESQSTIKPVSDFNYPSPDADNGPITIKKPVIYLYPKIKTDILVQLHYEGQIIADYPAYDPVLQGWNVTAYPDGHLINKADGKEYSYLFWEGESTDPIPYDLTQGSVVKGSETKAFLQESLSHMGLSPKEYNEFIVYWYPIMKDNPYNLIHFAGKEYTDTAPLTVTPTPDSIRRVFMVYKALENPITIHPQELTSWERKGFTVVEWGGSEL